MSKQLLLLISVPVFLSGCAANSGLDEAGQVQPGFVVRPAIVGWTQALHGSGEIPYSIGSPPPGCSNCTGGSPRAGGAVATASLMGIR